MAKIALCQDVMIEYMGYMSIAAVLKQAGHEVELFIDTHLTQDRFLREIARFNPDVVGLSVLTPSVPWALEVARWVKRETKALTILGGVHVIIEPEIVGEAGVDMVCVGEGEQCMTELCAALDAGAEYANIAGLWVNRDGALHRNPKRASLVDLETLPPLDRTLYDKYAYFRNSRFLRLIISRGCPYSCSFCYNPILREEYGRAGYLRRLSPERAVASIREMLRQHAKKVTYLFFVDEVFWTSNKWLREFLTLYKERIGIPFTANFRFGPIEEDDVRLMAEAGGYAVFIATESGDEKQRRELLGKEVSNEHILQVTSWLRKYGILFGTSAMFGLPGDSVEAHLKRLAFFRELAPMYLWTVFFQPYPGLPVSSHPDVLEVMPKQAGFSMTLHHEMYLQVPEREQLTRLKKVYHLCMRFPRLEKPLVALTRHRIPLLFDVLFMLHFSYYVFRIERLTCFQYLYHLKRFILTPLFRR